MDSPFVLAPKYRALGRFILRRAASYHSNRIERDSAPLIIIRRARFVELASGSPRDRFGIESGAPPPPLPLGPAATPLPLLRNAIAVNKVGQNYMKLRL